MARHTFQPRESEDVKAEIQDGRLVVSMPVDLLNRKLSGSGKNRILATTGGNITVPGFQVDDKPVVLSLNAYTEETAEATV